MIDMVDYGEGIRYKHYIDFLHQVHMSQAGVCLTYWVVAGNLHSQERVWPVMCMIRN